MEDSAGDRLVAQLNQSLPDGVEWDERELALLDLARRQANDIADLEALLAEQGGSVAGSMGQQRLNPIFGELRQQRLALARILSDIRMPDEGVAGGQKGTKSVKAQRAAETRWKLNG